MKLSVGDLRKAYNVLSLQPEFEPIELIRNVFSPMGEVVFAQGTVLVQEHIDVLAANAHVGYVDVKQTKGLLGALYSMGGSEYRPPTNHMSFDEVERTLVVLESVNRHSAHKRTLISCMDLFDLEGNLVFEVGEVLLLEKWQREKGRLLRRFLSMGDSEPTIAVRSSESQIAVYANFYLSEKERKKTFLINVNIVYNLINEEGHVRGMKVFEHLDWVRDVIVIDNPSSLLSTYKSNAIRLLVVEDSNNPAYRSQLVELKRYDPYARLMCVGGRVRASDRGFCNELAQKYTRDLWERP